VPGLALGAVLSFCTSLAGAQPALRIDGDIVTMDERGVVAGGSVLIRDGRIERVLNADDVEDAGAFRIATGAWVFPGLVNLHTHLPFDHQPLWVSDRKFDNRYEWQVYPPHVRAVMTPQDALMDPERLDLAREQTLFSEVRAMIGGTTAIAASPRTNLYTEPTRLVRNIEHEPTDGGEVRIRVEELDSAWRRDEAPALRAAFDSGELRAFVVHVAEGIDERSRDEFDRLERAGLLRPEVVVVHGTGLEADQLAALGRVGGHLVWAPTSNLLLYGEMADVGGAIASGVTVSLSNDWAPSGTPNLLAELKVAAAAYENRYGEALPAKTLVEMVTTNPARAIGWESKAGAIRAGAFADLILVAKHGEDPFEDLLRATEEDIELILINGKPVFGSAVWMGRLEPGDSERLEGTGRDGRSYVKRIDVTHAAEDVTLSQAVTRLREALQFKGYPEIRPHPLTGLFLSDDPLFFENLRAMEFPFVDVLERAYRPFAR